MLDLLKQLVKPPDVQNEQFDWDATEALLGCSLPHDYKQLVEVYGPGSFDDFLWLLTPSDKNVNLNLVERYVLQLQTLKTLSAGGEVLPCSPDVLLPWALADNGDVLYWQRTGDDPDLWPVLINESRGPGWLSFELSCSQFLQQSLSKSLRLPIFPDDFPSETVEFQPLEEREFIHGHDQSAVE